MLTLEKNTETSTSDAQIVQSWLKGEKNDNFSAKNSAFALQQRLHMIKSKSAILNAVELSDHVIKIVK